MWSKRWSWGVLCVLLPTVVWAADAVRGREERCTPHSGRQAEDARGFRWTPPPPDRRPAHDHGQRIFTDSVPDGRGGRLSCTTYCGRYVCGTYYR